jgi:hypothetical protein
VISDGAGGLIVGWTDARSGSRDIYAARVLSSGAPDPAWPVNGRPLCLAVGDQTNATLAPDGQAGCYAVWEDHRNGAPDIFAQRIDGDGSPEAGWPIDGLPICTAPDSQSAPVIVSDGAGGALIAWMDKRSGSDWNVFAQHLLPTGNIDPAWPAQGRDVCLAAGRQERLRVIPDDVGGFIVAWSDQRAGVGNDDIYAIRVQSNGTAPPGWPADGLAVCTAPGAQQFPVMAPDGSGGAIVAWTDGRAGTSNTDIFAEHVMATGTVDAAWPLNGSTVCGALGNQLNAAIVADGSHGALLAWSDQRESSTSDVYAQRLAANGAAHPSWPPNGAALSTALGSQSIVAMCTDGAGGAIVTWTDFRASLAAPDICAQHVMHNGIVDPEWTPDGAFISDASGSQASPKIVPDGSGGAVMVWTDARNGSTNADIYAQRVQPDGQLGGDVVGVRCAINDGLSLGSVRPNPVRGDLIRFDIHLPSDRPVFLEIIDALGRRVVRRQLNGVGAGSHVVELGEVGDVAPGTYFLRVVQGGMARQARLTLVN